MLHGVEALVRWEHPERGLIGPDHFIPAIDHAPVMASVTRWVLTEACRETAKHDWKLSVNVSASDASRPRLVNDVIAALNESGLDPNRLTLEITETVFVNDLDAAIRVLEALRRVGVGISLDDFGTGYSSLRYLRELPVTEVKIDRSFVGELDRNSDDAAIVTGVVRLAQAVGLGVVAEGVERLGQLNFLNFLGCPLGQGYLWCRPMPLADVLEVRFEQTPEDIARGSMGGGHVDETARQTISDLVRAGASLHTIAAALNKTGVRTDRGTQWRASGVAQVIASMNLNR
jgi:EAL domain-containing protein (putative c-di-GMP-specific phosphodiesterase class I)